MTGDLNPFGVQAHRHRNPHGTEGGWVADTATVASTAHIGRSARVSGWARVSDSARVSGSARVSETRHVVTVGPVGSEDRTVTCHRTDTGHQIVAGCWQGTADELAARIDSHKAWPDADKTDRKQWRKDYRDALRVFRHRINEWETEQ